MQCGRLPNVPLTIPDRADAHLDAAAERAPPQLRRGAGDGVGRERIAVRIPPRPVLAGHRQLALHLLVVRLQVRVGDRPVGADPVAGVSREVRGVKPRACSRRSAPSSRPRRDRSCSCPSRSDRSPPITRSWSSRAGALPPRRRPSPRRVPERARLDDHDPPAPAGQPLGEHRTARAGTDDHEVHLVVVGVAAIVSSPGRSRRWTSSRNRESLARGPDRALEQSAPDVARSSGATRTGLRRSRLAARTARRRARPDRPGACSPAGRPGRRSRSRSTPRGGSRTRPGSPRMHTDHARARRPARPTRRRPAVPSEARSTIVLPRRGVAGGEAAAA